MKEHRFASLIGNLELFRHLPEEELSLLLTQSKEEFFEANKIIFKEGDTADRFYMLLEGSVEVWKNFDTAYADILAVRHPGICFGEMSLIDDLPRSATIKTISPVKLLTLDKEHFQQTIKEQPNVALGIMKTVSKMVRVSNETYSQGLQQKNRMLEKAYADLEKAQEELLRNERLSSLGKFASLIIHDLRNPIAIIKGYAQILVRQIGDAEKSGAHAGKLLAECDRLNRLVEELLDYSRGDIRLSLKKHSVDALFHKLRDHFSDVFLKYKIELVLTQEVGEEVVYDFDRMLRVFTNLMDNAKKAMRNGGRLLLSADIQGDDLHFKVTDTGEGMTEEIREKLFDAFFSASASGGTGLGLLVVSNVIEAHGGSVSVCSEAGRGSSFQIKIPRNLQPNQ
jgi:signal transduction histidine kinase